jgi:hypothetical protein
MAFEHRLTAPSGTKQHIVDAFHAQVGAHTTTFNSKLCVPCTVRLRCAQILLQQVMAQSIGCVQFLLQVMAQRIASQHLASHQYGEALPLSIQSLQSGRTPLLVSIQCLQQGT